MNFFRIAAICAFFALGQANAAAPSGPVARSETTNKGRYDTYASFPSIRVAPRTVTVFVPAGAQPAEGYSVLYMHDGRNVFFAATANGGEPWGADQAVVDGHYPLIVVAVDHGPARWSEYMPMSVYGSMPEDLAEATRGKEPEPVSDNYVDFLVRELKPFVDAHYPTRTDARHTFVAGSSMGGLISIHALERHPETFSRAAGLSTHWPATTQFELFGQGPGSADVRLAKIANHTADTLAQLLPDAATHRLWIDYGTETLDAYYEPYAVRFQQHAMSQGYANSLVLRAFAGTAHNEMAWRKRFPEVLQFLMDGN